MKSDTIENVIIIYGVKKNNLNEINDLFNNFTNDYNYEIKLFEAGDNIHSFSGYKNRILCIYGEDENEFRILKDEFYNKHIKNVADRIVLCSKIDSFRFIPWFGSHCYIEMGNKDNAFVEMRKILDSYIPKKMIPLDSSHCKSEQINSTKT
jgi:hypothetical protein